MKTRTGSFPLGFRRGWSDWQKDLPSLIIWTQANNLEVIDLGKDGDQAAPAVIEAGLRVGSVDLADWHGMISPDKGKRAEAVAKTANILKPAPLTAP